MAHCKPSPLLGSQLVPLTVGQECSLSGSRWGIRSSRRTMNLMRLVLPCVCVVGGGGRGLRYRVWEGCWGRGGCFYSYGKVAFPRFEKLVPVADTMILIMWV